MWLVHGNVRLLDGIVAGARVLCEALILFSNQYHVLFNHIRLPRSNASSVGWKLSDNEYSWVVYKNP